MKRLLFVLFLLLAGLSAYAQVLIPVLSQSEIPLPKTQNGLFVWIDGKDSLLKGIDYRGNVWLLYGKPSKPDQPAPMDPKPEAPGLPKDLSDLHAPGILKDGDLLFTLTTPMAGVDIRQKVFVRFLPTGNPVFVVQVGGAEPVIKQNEYLANYIFDTSREFSSFIRPLIQSKVFAGAADLSGPYAPNRPFPNPPTGAASALEFKPDATVSTVITTIPDPVTPTGPSSGGRPVLLQRIDRLAVSPSSAGSGIAWDQIPAYQVPEKGIWPSSRGTLAEQVAWVRKGSNYISLEELVDLVETKKTLTPAQAAARLGALNLPATTGVYGMIYQNAFPEGLWTNPQKVMTADVYGFLSSWIDMRKNKLGWKSHPMVIDLDFERAPGTYIGLKTVCDAIARIRKENPEVEFLYYASNPDNMWGGTGGDSKNPYGVVTALQRHQMLRDAGVRYYDGAWYFHGGVEAERLIGTGKPFRDGYDFAEKFVGPIEQTIRLSDDLTAWPDLAHIDWVMEKYEGNIAGTADWPMVGGWILESLPLWGQVQGKFRAGGGILNWGYGAPNFQMTHIEAGKWRVFQFNRFWNDPTTVYNIKPDFSFDGGKTWHSEAEYRYTWDQVTESWESPRPYIRAAYRDGELLVAAVACRKVHVGATPQIVRVRYEGVEFDLTLNPAEVLSVVVPVEKK